MKKNIKSITVLVLLVAILVYSIISLSQLPKAPVETDFADAAAYEAALAEHEEIIQPTHAKITIGVLLVAAVSFALEAVPVAVTAMFLPVFFGITGILSFKEAFAGFADSTVILFAAMFVLGAALFQTGLARKIGMFVVRLFSGSETKLLVGILCLTACMSAFLSNTGTVAVLLPIVMEIADSQGWSRGKLLLPMAYVSSAAGTCTMVGTPPNLTVNAVLSTYGFETVNFFEFAWYGIPMTIVTILYLSTLGKKLIPDRGPAQTAASNVNTDHHDPKKQLIAGGTLIVVIIMLVWGVVDLAIIAAAGALLCVVTGCLNEKQAYQAIDWSTIFLFAGALSLANAMATTGAGSMIARLCVDLMGGDPSPYLVLTVLFFVTDILTEFMSNTASAALLCPIGLEIAAVLEVSPIAIVLSIGFAASAAYLTPVSTPPNTLVYGPGNLKFTDYVKSGLPLFFLAYIVAVLIVPMVWPFK